VNRVKLPWVSPVAQIIFLIIPLSLFFCGTRFFEAVCLLSPNVPKHSQKGWREKQRASRPPKPRRRTLEELAKLKREGVELTPEEAERLADYRRRKNESVRRCMAKKEKATSAISEEKSGALKK